MWFATVLGLLGMIVLHIGIGIQKMGVVGMEAGGKRGDEKSEEQKKAFWIWIGGIAITGLGAVGNFFALRAALSASTLAVFSGIGLLALVIFAGRYLEEAVGKAEIGALVFILTGTALGATPADSGQPLANAMLWLLVVSGCGLSAAIIVTIVGPWRHRELCQGALSGVLGGLAINAQKELALQSMGSSSVVYIALWTALTVGAFTVMNLAFRKERAVVLVPLGASCSVLAAVAVGYNIQGEKLGFVHLAGVLLTIAGVYLMAKNAVPAGQSQAAKGRAVHIANRGL